MWMKIASSHLPKIIFYELQNTFNLRTLKIHSSYFTVRKSYILLILTPFVEAFLEITVIFRSNFVIGLNENFLEPDVVWDPADEGAVIEEIRTFFKKFCNKIVNKVSAYVHVQPVHSFERNLIKESNIKRS